MAERWNFSANRVWSLGIARGRLFVASEEGLVALKLSDGATVLKTPLKARVVAATEAGIFARIMTGVATNDLVLLDWEGGVQWRRPFSRIVETLRTPSGAVADMPLAATALGGGVQLHRIDPLDGDSSLLGEVSTQVVLWRPQSGFHCAGRGEYVHGTLGSPPRRSPISQYGDLVAGGERYFWYQTAEGAWRGVDYESPDADGPELQTGGGYIADVDGVVAYSTTPPFGRSEAQPRIRAVRLADREVIWELPGSRVDAVGGILQISEGPVRQALIDPQSGAELGGSSPRRTTVLSDGTHFVLASSRHIRVLVRS